MRAERDYALRVLRSCPVFAPLSPEPLAVLAEMVRIDAYGAGETVCEAGEAAAECYVVASGSLAVMLPGAEAPVRTLGPGEVLGEYGLFTERVRTATVLAVRESELLVVDYERLQRLLLEFPEATFSLLSTTVRRLIDAERRERSRR